MKNPRQDHLEYLKTLKRLADGQYGYSEEEEVTEENSWVWAEPLAKEKLKNIVFNGVVDATNLRKEEIKGALAKARNIRVGNFTIRISDFYGRSPLEKGILSFFVLEKKTRTPSGAPCNMDLKIDITKDSRFHDRPWLTYFSGYEGRDIPIDTIIDIVKWMQIIQKLSAFL